MAAEESSALALPGPVARRPAGHDAVPPEPDRAEDPAVNDRPGYLMLYLDRTSVGDSTHSCWEPVDRWLLAVIPADEIDELLTHFRS